MFRKYAGFALSPTRWCVHFRPNALASRRPLLMRVVVVLLTLTTLLPSTGAQDKVATPKAAETKQSAAETTPATA
ncbi:MAG: hypothetical protein IT423_18025, partial [Pirellulaceae bacterium]|nr:hypothetical protein [Pirellulaceae bacterium]